MIDEELYEKVDIGKARELAARIEKQAAMRGTP
jgi:hypothetical protein